MKVQDLRPWNRRLRGLRYAPHGKRINLACGNLVLEGFLNVDSFPASEDVMKVDLWKPPWPLESDTYDYILASHICEHVPHQFPGVQGEGWFHFVEEIIRIGRDGAILEVQVPNPKWIANLELPGHVRLVSPRTFHPWTMDTIGESSEGTVLSNGGRLKLIKTVPVAMWKRGPLSDFHPRRYLGLEVGPHRYIVYLFRLCKE